ncbi:uncharacterized protein PAC_05523 [Phialocephala subalpina]|uniref:C2H2-type domain-containing protein n=1 Tax=Phialocephala subalpina TaxID=576137 RepID=A0A1L7WSA6_9HELO|nr:uncharacterized protein PAC_05523 [Phialocephala subalpina]
MLCILQGLHGLQVYANQYRYKHIVAYMDLVVTQKLEVPPHFVLQLEGILKYSKVKATEGLIGSAAVGTSKDENAAERHSSLERFPGLSSLVSNLEGFRNGLKKQDWTQKSIETVSLEVRSSDPSWLSSIRHCYQSVLKDLLNPTFSQRPASVSEEELRKFRDTYRDSAFTCRYPHCDRAAEGFDSSQEREKHEAKHRREYRCDAPTCAYSEMGFATRAQLNRHTRKHDSEIADETRLAEAVRAFKRRRLSFLNHASADPEVLGYTAYLELPVGQFRTADDITEKNGSAIPSCKDLEVLLEPLELAVDVVKIRNSVCDRAMRMLSQARKDRLEEIETEGRDEERKERLKRDAADEEERGRNKANKVKKRKDFSSNKRRESWSR